jgi:hypothetical protein
MLSNQIDKLTSEYIEICKLVYPDYAKSSIYDSNGRLLVEKKAISELSKAFVGLVEARNALAVENGYGNFFEFVLDWDGVDKRLLLNFLNSSEIISEKYLDLFNSLNLDLTIFHSARYTPNYSIDFIDDESKIVDLIEKYYLEDRHVSPTLLSKIEIVTDENAPYFSSMVVGDKAIVTVLGPKNSNTFATNLCHEYSHAIFQLELLRNGLSSSDIKMFEQERVAINDEYQFQEKYLDETSKTYSKLNMFDRFISTYFENEVYSYSGSSGKKLEIVLGEMYSKSRKKCLPLLNEEENYSFLFDSFLVTMPCYYANYSVLYFEKLFL